MDLSAPLPDQSLQHELIPVTAQGPLGTCSRSAKVGPSILRMSQYALLTRAYVPSPAKVTGHVPLETSCGWSAECRTTNLDRDSLFFPLGFSVASQVRESGFVFLPNLACNLLCRLLTSQVSQEKERQFTRLFCPPRTSDANFWRQLPDVSLLSVLSAPTKPQAWSFRTATLPGHTSVSGDDCGNALAQACIRARWGETSSPETNFEVCLCTEPGQDLDLTPRPLRFSPFLSRALTTQGGRADHVKVPQVGPVQPGAQVVPMRGQAYEGPENEGDEQNEEVWVPGVGAISLDDPNPEPLKV